jgi:hypothetical protein
VDADQAVDVHALRNVDERQRYEIALDERDVGGKSRGALVHVDERLQIGNLRHQEEGLLEWIANGSCFLQQGTEGLGDQLRNGSWYVG